MSDGQRAGLVVLLLAAVLASGWWVWRRLVGSAAPELPRAATPAEAPPPAPATAAATLLTAPRGYRLAGVAVGDPESFAVIEAPNGTNVLYRAGAEIPGLGRLQHIEAERIVVESDAGQMELWLMPAATPTPTRVRTPTLRVVTSTPPARSPSPTPPPGGASAPRSTS